MTINRDLIDVVLQFESGYPDAMAAEDDRSSLCMAAGETAREFPQHLWIEPKEWPKVAAENDRYKTWPIDYIDRFTNQGPGNGKRGTHECTCHALRAVAECCWNRQRKIAAGPPEDGVRKPSSKLGSVWFSQIGIYAEANPRQWGGASTRGVLEIAVRRGFIPESIQPREYGFKHMLHGTCGGGNSNNASGDWVPLSRFPQGWEGTAEHFKPLEIIVPESWEQIVCLVLNGYSVGVGRSGHAIPYGKWIVGDDVMGYVDSYNIVRYDSIRTIKSAVGSAYTIATMTMPDDWNKPAE